MILELELDTVEQVPDIVEALDMFAVYCRTNGSEGVAAAMERIVTNIGAQYPEAVVHLV